MQIRSYHINASADRLRGLLADHKSSLVVNWGLWTAYLGQSELSGQGSLLNCDTSLARDKVKAFRRFDAYNIPTVEWTVKADTASGWNAKYLARKNFDSNGRGIVTVEAGEQPPPGTYAAFYTRFIEGVKDVRLHVVADRVIGVQVREGDKLLIKDGNELFEHVNVKMLPLLRRAATQAVRALLLDFGAVDFGVTPRGFVVFEVNTAPSIGDAMAQRYAGAFKSL